MRKYPVLIIVMALFSFSLAAQSAMRFVKRGETEKAIQKADAKVARAWERKNREKPVEGQFSLKQAPWDDETIYYGITEAADIYYDCGLFQKAKELYEWSLPVCLKKYPEGKRDYNKLVMKLAECCVETGDHKRAEELNDILARTVNFNTNSVEAEVEMGVRLEELIHVYQQLGLLKKANALQDEALAHYLSYTNNKRLTDAAVVLTISSDMYATIKYMKIGSEAIQYCIETAQYERAEMLVSRIMALAEVKYGKENPYGPDKQGDLWLAMGRYAEALELFQKMRVNIDASRKKITDLNNGWLNYRLADSHLGLRQYSEAERYFREAITIAGDKSGKRADLLESYASVGLASALHLQKRDEEALHTASTALAAYNRLSVFAKKMGEKRIDRRIRTGLNMNVGLAYWGLKKYDSAEYYMTRTLNGQNGFPQYKAKTNLYMAGLFADTQQHEKAVVAYKASIDSWLKFWQYNLFTLSEKERADFLNAISSAVESFNNYAVSRYMKDPSLVGEMYTIQLAVKGVLLNSSNKVRMRVLNSGNAALISQYDQWQLRKSFLIKAYQLSDAEIKERGVDMKALETEVNHMEKELSQNSQLVVDDSDNTFFSWQEVQKKLLPGEASVEIVRIPRLVHIDSVLYAAIVIKSGDAVPAMIVMTKGLLLETRYAKYYRNMVTLKTSDKYSYAEFWAPLSKSLAGVKKIYFCPDGVYNQINVSVLENPATRKYILDELNIQLVTNSKEIIYRKSNTGKPGDVTLFGAPDFSGKAMRGEGASNTSMETADLDSLRSMMGGTIADLPGTRQEMLSITKVLSAQKIRNTAFMGNEAIEEQLKKIKNPETLHFATHGYFLTDTEITKDFSFMGFDHAEVSHNPLLRSGLLLAGAQNAMDGIVTSNKDDGILTAQEAMGLELDKTNLVILSACETGLGKIKNGEGVYGLQRAFLKAGAQAVLMSLWKVDDAATQQLMTSFYEQWIKSGNKRDALLQAQKKVRTKYPHPYYWGAFVMIGD